MSATVSPARKREVRNYVPFSPPGGFKPLPQRFLVGGDITPALSADQTELLRLQARDHAIRTATKCVTKGVYKGLGGKAANPIQTIDEAFTARSLDQAKHSAGFLSRNGKAFYVVPDLRREGGFVCVPEAKAKPYIEAALVVCVYGDPTPPKPAKAGRLNKADKAAGNAADTPGGQEQADTPKAAEGPSAANLNPFTGEPLDFAGNKAALSGYCAMQLRGNGWNEASVQVVCAAVATGIINDTVAFGDVVCTTQAIRYVDRESPPVDVAAFAEAIQIQEQGGLYLYHEYLQDQAAKITLGEIIDEHLYPKARRVTHILSGLGRGTADDPFAEEDPSA